MDKVDTRLPERFQDALAALRAEPLSGTEKGLPPVRLPLGEVGRQGWNILRGDVPLPVMVLRKADVEHNVRLLQDYCDRHGAWLSPHGKTTMAPQLFALQLAAGSWAMTVANIAQVQVCRAFGLQRLLIANEIVSDYDTRYLAQEMRADPNFEPFVLVDSPAGVERLRQAMAAAGLARPLPVFVEMGYPGSRCGVRDVPALLEVARLVQQAAPALRLAGVEAFEGLVTGATQAERTAAADSFLATLAEGARAVRALAPADQPFFVTAGGSTYFDRVVAWLGRAALPEAQLILRSGCYITHDSVTYEERSPLGRRAGDAPPDGRLRAALEVWATVLSRPEPDLAILSMGLRDMPVDLGFPVPFWRSRGGARAEPFGQGSAVFKSNDQHAYLRLAPGADLQVGDRVGCGISHPCTAFDKWRVLLVVDEERNVVDAIRTFF